MPHYKDPDNKLHWLDSAEFQYLLPPGSVEITAEEAEAIREANQPTPDPVEMKRRELEQISLEMLRSGIFEPFAEVIRKDAIKTVRELFPEITESMTDEQIDAALSDPESPYYNQRYARTKWYEDRLKNAGGEPS